jgi:hypothetical protein
LWLIAHGRRTLPREAGQKPARVPDTFRTATSDNRQARGRSLLGHASQSPIRASVGSSLQLKFARGELGVAQIAARCLWRRDPADELLAVVAEIADREYDRLDALGGAACIGTTTARELSQLGLQEILKARNAVRRSRGARPTRSSRPKVTRTRPQTSDPSRYAHRPSWRCPWLISITAGPWRCFSLTMSTTLTYRVGHVRYPRVDNPSDTRT